MENPEKPDINSIFCDIMESLDSIIKNYTLKSKLIVNSIELDLLRQAAYESISAVEIKFEGLNADSSAKKEKALNIATKIAKTLGVSDDKLLLLDDIIESTLYNQSIDDESDQ